MEGIWLGSKKAVLDKWADDSPMIRPSKAGRGRSGPDGKVKATEKAEASKERRKELQVGGRERLERKCGAPAAGRSRHREAALESEVRTFTLV